MIWVIDFQAPIYCSSILISVWNRERQPQSAGRPVVGSPRCCRFWRAGRNHMQAAWNARHRKNRLGVPEPVGVAQRTALDHVVFPLLAKGHGPAADTTAGIGSHEVVRFGLCGRPSVQRIVGRRGTASHAGAGRMLETRHAARGRAHSSARHEDRAFGEPCAWQPREPGHDRAGGDA